MILQQYAMTVREVAFGRWKVHSQFKDEEYLVKYIARGQSFTCDCGDSIYRGRECKHIREVRAQSASSI